MKTAPLKFAIMLAVFAFNCKTFAQTSLPDTGNNSVAVQNAIDIYHQFVFPETNLYNGREYIDYAYTLNEGIPFFSYPDFVTGSVLYNRILYKNVPVLYDVVNEEVVILNPSRTNKISLNIENVSGFDLKNLHFVKLIADSLKGASIRSGFYAVLYDGKTDVYLKQSKKILESILISEGVRRSIDEQNEYYILKNEVFYPVTSKKSLLKILKDKKKDVQQFIKRNKLNIRKEKYIALAKVAAYYDEITNR